MSVYKRFYKRPWGKQLVDQSGHILLGFVVTLPTLLIPFAGWSTFMALGTCALVAGVAREVEQMSKPGKRGWYSDRTIDSLFHIPGGLVVALIACVR